MIINNASQNYNTSHVILTNFQLSLLVILFLGTRVRVYTEVGKSEQGKFALDVGVKLLDVYNE